MNYEKIKKSLQRVLSLLEDCERDGVSAVEYDLMLKELRESYSAVRFECNPASEPIAAAETEHEATPAVSDVAEPTAEEPEMAVEESREASDSFFKPEESNQHRRRMFVRSLYDASAPEKSAAPQPETEREPEPEPQAESQAGHTTIEVSAETDVAENRVESTEPADPAAETSETAEQAETTESVTEEVVEQQPEPEAVVELSEQPAETAPEAKAEEAPEAETVTQEPETTEVTEVEEVTEPTEPEAEAEATETEHPTAETQPAEHNFTAESAEPVLGDVINADVQTFADTFAPTGDAVADIVGKEAIGSLNEAIGINDRFLLIRDLFDGNPEAFGQAVEKLDSFENLDDCLVHIVENYDWNPHCDGAKLMMTLLERRYGHK